MYVYLPNYAGLRTIAALKSVGLESLHDDGLTLEFADVLEHGPDGGAGVICGWGSMGVITAHRPAVQEWHKVVKQTLDNGTILEAGRAWLGWDSDNPPTPENLARKSQLGGEWLPLDDGNRWLIATAKYYPRLMELDEDTGAVTSVIAPAYREFFEFAWNTLQKFTITAEKAIINDEVGFHAAVRILALNYRMSRDLAFRLKLIGDRSMLTIPMLACEVGHAEDYLAKKKQSATSAS